MDRDPRKDPKAGDVLKDGSVHIRVKATSGKKVSYELTCNGRSKPIYLIPMICTATLKRWRSTDLEVLHAAD